MATGRFTLSQIVKTFSKRGTLRGITVPRVKSGKGRMVWIRRSDDLRVDSAWQEGKTSTILGVLDDIDKADEQPGVYCGFDPTADSLHLGHLSLLYMMFRLSQHGYPVTALIGGATSKLGDPAGKGTSRDIQSESVQLLNAAKLEQQIQALYDKFSSALPHPTPDNFRIVNNKYWYENMTVDDYINEIAANFKLVNMVSRSVVKKRLERSADMRFSEFVYMTFQAYDWYQLYTQHNCRIQLGGFDQIGNIEDGFSYIWMRPNSARPELAGLTIPLLTTSDGEKLGKSQNKKTVWLNTKKSPLDKTEGYLQSLQDRDVKSVALSILDTPVDEIRAMSKKQAVEVLMRELEAILPAS